MFDKTIEGRLWGVTTQNSTVRLTMGDSSGGTFTGRPNPFRGTLVWDDFYCVLQKVAVAGGATGGSYSVYLESDAVFGNTGLPLAGVSIGPNSPVTIVMTSLHNSPGSVQPTHLNIVQSASGGGLTMEVFGTGKQYRGVLGSPASKTAERIIQGNMLRGTSSDGKFGDDKGIAASATFTMGTSCFTLGMHRLRLWDRAFYWVRAGASLSGTHNVAIVGKEMASGTTFAIAATTTSATGVLALASTIRPLYSNLYGISPNPTNIIWTVVSAGGVSDARVICVAKSGRGSLGKA